MIEIMPVSHTSLSQIVISCYELQIKIRRATCETDLKKHSPMCFNLFPRVTLICHQMTKTRNGPENKVGNELFKKLCTLNVFDNLRSSSECQFRKKKSESVLHQDYVAPIPRGSNMR